MKAGMAYLPEDRKKDGILADLSVRENIIIALQAKRGMFHPMKRKEMEDAATNFINLLQIKTASMETPIKSLSGGNQQKVVLARWLATHPKILILNGPTVGVDIGAKYDIHKLLRELAKQGMAVLVVSDDVAEITALCDRALLMIAGSKPGEFTGVDLTDDNLYKSTI